MSNFNLYPELQNGMSKCLLFIMGFTSNSTCPKTELITFPPKPTLSLFPMSVQVSKIETFETQVPLCPAPPHLQSTF